ncbi:hypothetical protein V8G54_013703 [Vigna mungo]|uniref:AMP-dependent synthetase/ligase domain-containing protein n=1 Tax=Vigna mungo TaxID=3915 RepID=A0AAQ3NJE2_VIGMU
MTTLLELIQKYRVTVASFVPPIVLALVKSGEAHRYDLSSVRAVVTGAAPLGKELQEAVESRLPHATFGQVVFYKRIGRVFFTDSIPKAASGKILRKVLSAKVNEGVVVAN